MVLKRYNTKEDIEREIDSKTNLKLKLDEKSRVDENLKDEELQNYLTESSEIDDEIEDALYAGSLQVADTEYLYKDPHNNDGGHL